MSQFVKQSLAVCFTVDQSTASVLCASRGALSLFQIDESTALSCSLQQLTDCTSDEVWLEMIRQVTTGEAELLSKKVALHIPAQSNPQPKSAIQVEVGKGQKENMRTVKAVIDLQLFDLGLGQELVATCYLVQVLPDLRRFSTGLGRAYVMTASLEGQEASPGELDYLSLQQVNDTANAIGSVDNESLARHLNVSSKDLCSSSTGQPPNLPRKTGSPFLDGNADHSSNNDASNPGRAKRSCAPYKEQHIALQIMYMGKGYHGFASQAGPHPTIEARLFTALERTKLLPPGGRSASQYSRCGRTDKGVNALGQVVALLLRSNLGNQPLPPVSASEVPGCQSQDQAVAARASRHLEAAAAATCGEGEIDYVATLNRALPDAIRVLGWCPVGPSFSARFSCLSREYLYFFVDSGLDVQLMKATAAHFVGYHDFRNFCKMDAANVKNFAREVTAFDIEAVQDFTGLQGSKNVWAMRVRGNAFLWHQVRCMAAVLFLVGRHLEPPQVVKELLDLSVFPRKPQYVMAEEGPLLLASCSFQGIKFRCSTWAHAALKRHVSMLLEKSVIESAILSTAWTQLSTAGGAVSPGCHKQTKAATHVPLSKRPTEPTFEERCAKLKTNARVPADSRIPSADIDCQTWHPQNAPQGSRH